MRGCCSPCRRKKVPGDAHHNLKGIGACGVRDGSAAAAARQEGMRPCAAELVMGGKGAGRIHMHREKEFHEKD